MAPSANMLLILATSVMIASVVAAVEPALTLPSPLLVTKYEFVCYQQIYDSNQKLVFPPYYSPPEGPAAGQGYVFNDPCTAKDSPDSKELATVSGFYVYTSNDREQEKSSIEFHNFKNRNGDFVNATISITGDFESTNGVDNDEQELSIIGGTKGLAGAEGNLKYTKVASGDGFETYKVEGSLTVPSSYHH